MRHDNYADFWLCYYESDWSVMGENESEDENERQVKVGEVEMDMSEVEVDEGEVEEDVSEVKVHKNETEMSERGEDKSYADKN